MSRSRENDETGSTSLAESREASAKGGFWGLRGATRVVAILLAVATAIGTLWGAIKAINEAAEWLQKDDPPGSQPELARTPWLGLEFWQDGTQAAMSYVNPESTQSIRVTMKRTPFEMRFPTVAPKVAIRVCAWNDQSIFNLQEGISLEEVPYFEPGSGVADTDYSSGTLYLNNRGNNYLIDTRIAHVSEIQDKVFFGVTWLAGARTPLSQRDDDIFLTVFIDKNDNKAIDNGEYEYIILEF